MVRLWHRFVQVTSGWVTSSIAPRMLRLVTIVEVIDRRLVAQCRKAATMLMFTGESLLVLPPAH